MFPLRDTIPSKSFPIVTVSIIVLNVIVFFYEVSMGPKLNAFLNQYGAIPAQYANFFSQSPPQMFDASIRLFTSIFLHGSWMHLIGNMWYLWIFGDNIEDRTGRFRFIVFYIVCGLLASAAHILFNLQSEIPTVGASGAIAGVLGAYLLLYPKSRILTLIFLFFFIQVIEIRAIYFLGIWILFQILSGSMSAGVSGQAGGVAWWAHIGGFFSGMILIFLFRKPKK